MKIILITGASRGIGKALAQKFLDVGNIVIGTSRNGTADFHHENLTIVPLELTDERSREMCVQRIAESGKKIDILINNAGMWHEKDDQSVIDISVLRETLEANLLGPIDFTERLVSMINPGGHIINLSSRRGSLTNTKESLYPDYGISKAALNMFTRILAARLKGIVTVASVHPGFVQTDMNEGEGDISSQEAARDIYELVNKDIETGQFWFKNEKLPW